MMIRTELSWTMTSLLFCRAA